MRIAIDLHPSLDDATLAQVTSTAAGLAAAGHTVVALLHHAHGERSDAARLALAPLLAAHPAQVQVRVLDTARGADAWRRRAATLLRDTLLRDVQADVAWHPGQSAPGVGDRSGSDRFPAGDSDSGGFPAIPVIHGMATAGLAAVQQALLAAVPDTDTDIGGSGGVVGGGGAGSIAGATAVKPRMAYLSPLPPQHSGIADYSVELLAELEHYYDIELIVDAAPDAHLAQRYTVRDCAWFEQHGGQYQRVLYHFGNSPVHQHMFALLQRHPGIVVLHDFFLSNLLDAMEHDGYAPQALAQALYASHGYGALQAAARDGRNAAVWAYPCNWQVLEHASGVIVHSDFSRRLAQQWYGADTGADWQTLPLIRGLPRGHDAGRARAAARSALGLAEDSFVVCSFGMMGVTKLNNLLLEAFLASPLAADRRCHLVFVGKADPDRYGSAIAHRIAKAGVAATIHITGFVSSEQYATWLAGADAAVQLRSRTRGETSASVLDCLLHGLPTVVNAHGSNTDLPADVLVQLPDVCDAAMLGSALTGLHRDAALRADLASRARAYMAAHHTPQQVGPRFHQAIETLAAHQPHRHYAELLDALRRLPPAPAGALMETAAAIAANRLPRGPRQLFVDVSALVHTDLRTGIQRVVRSILLDLIAAPPPGYRIEPVYGTSGGAPYRYARAYTFKLLGLPPVALEDAPLELRAGDLFLGLDLFAGVTIQSRSQLLDMRRRGVRMHFVVYDLLPVLQPAMFPAGTDDYFRDYLDTIAAVADGLVCISRAVADELHDWLAQRPAFAPGGRAAADPLPIAYFHLGADINASAPSTGLPADASDILAAIAARPSLLLVGTLEPRKGQAQALAAVELLWQQGVDVNLVIVGKAGWMMETLARQLEQHAERGRRLFWLAGVSDEMLLKLYQACSALVAASNGEGFGLPLIEAAQHGLPIIARDLPVFREVGGAHASYFSGTAPADLAQALRDWLDLHAAGAAPGSAGMPWLTWKASTAQLLQALQVPHVPHVPDGRQPYRVLTSLPSGAPAFSSLGAA